MPDEQPPSADVLSGPWTPDRTQIIAAKVAQLRDRADLLDAFPQHTDQHRAAQCMEQPTVYELQQRQSAQTVRVAATLVDTVHGAADLPRRELLACRAAAVEALRTLSPAWRQHAQRQAGTTVQVLLQQDGLLDALVMARRSPERFAELCQQIGRAAMISARAALQDETPPLGVYLRAYAEDVEAGR